MENLTFLNRFINECINILKNMHFLVLPISALLLIVWLEVFSAPTNDLILMLLGVILMVIGLPLSAALRMDELSMDLTLNLSREIVLLVALLIVVVNITFVLGVSRAILKYRKTNE